MSQRLCARITPLFWINHRRILLRKSILHHSRRNIVKRIARLVQLRRYLADLLAVEPFAIMDSHLRDFTLVLLAETRRIPQDRKIVVGRPRLEERLAPRHILVHRPHFAPYRVPWVHLYRRVEAPARPDGFDRRVATTVEEHMIHAGEEEPVDEHLNLLRPLAEVLVDPCATFG